ncbi:MAG TPA: glutaredoxin family protein [Candidatus Binatia bacterium]|nr:glutaredoxin family protein [Candidatus Binatia bacterium]
MGESNQGGERRVVVLSRAECCLCHEAIAAAEEARRVVPFALEVVDVDGDPQLRDRYGEEVPVVLVDGRKAFKYRVTSAQLVRRLRRRRWLPAL